MLYDWGLERDEDLAEGEAAHTGQAMTFDGQPIPLGDPAHGVEDYDDCPGASEDEDAPVEGE